MWYRRASLSQVDNQSLQFNQKRRDGRLGQASQCPADEPAVERNELPDLDDGWFEEASGGLVR